MTSFAFILGVVPLVLGHGCRRRDAANARHRRVQRHARRDGVRHFLYAGVLLGRSEVHGIARRGQRALRNRVVMRPPHDGVATRRAAATRMAMPCRTQSRHRPKRSKSLYSRISPHWQSAMSKKKKATSEAAKLKRSEYEEELRRLQGELCTLQAWVKEKGLRVIVVFEGRDGAGKGGTIRAITERVSPRVFRSSRLPAPSDREKIADVHAAVHAALSGRRRDRDLRPQLVQPRRRRARDGLLHARSSISGFSSSAQKSRSTSSTAASSSQVLAGGQQRGTGTAIPGPHRTTRSGSGSSARWTCRRASAGTTTRARDAMLESDRHETRTVAHPALRRQEAGPAQLHRASAEPDSVQEAAAERIELPTRSKRRRLRRPGLTERAKVRSREVLGHSTRQKWPVVNLPATSRLLRHFAGDRIDPSPNGRRSLIGARHLHGAWPLGVGRNINRNVNSVCGSGATRVPASECWCCQYVLAESCGRILTDFFARYRA